MAEWQIISCPLCGDMVRIDMDACPRCHEPLHPNRQSVMQRHPRPNPAPAPATDPEEPRHSLNLSQCPTCGDLVRLDWDNCSRCGSRLNELPPYTRPMPAEPPPAKTAFEESQPDASTVENLRHCPLCGEMVLAHWVECPHCRRMIYRLKQDANPPDCKPLPLNRAARAHLASFGSTSNWTVGKCSLCGETVRSDWERCPLCGEPVAVDDTW